MSHNVLTREAPGTNKYNLSNGLALCVFIMLHILWETVTTINNVSVKRERNYCSKRRTEARCCVMLGLRVCQCVCFYSRWTQMKQCSQWLSTYSLTEPPLSPLISPMRLCSPQMHSSIIRSQITVILQGWEITHTHTHTHTHIHTHTRTHTSNSPQNSKHIPKKHCLWSFGPICFSFLKLLSPVFSVQHLFIKLCLLQLFNHCDKWTQRGN